MVIDNTGHGHVHPRSDGVKARCGGPGICSVCSKEAGVWKAPVLELNNSFPVVLYFGSEEDRGQFIELVNEVHPSLRAVKL